MKVLITGGTGSLGNYLVPPLQKRGYQIAIFSRDEFKQHRMKQNFPDLTYFVGDVRNIHRLREVVRTFKPNLIIHAAAMKRIEVGEDNPYEVVLTNIIGAKNVVEIAKDQGINAIGVSTDKAVKPVNVYGMSKAIQERIFTNEGFNCVRYGNVVGSRGSVIPLFAKLAKEGKPLTITNPEMTRFLLELKDAVDLIFQAMDNKPDGLIFVKKSPMATVKDIASVFSDKISIIGERPGEKLHEVLVSEDEMPRTTETEKYFIIGRKQVSKKRWEYSSSNTKRLEKEELKRLLKVWREDEKEI